VDRAAGNVSDPGEKTREEEKMDAAEAAPDKAPRPDWNPAKAAMHATVA